MHLKSFLFRRRCAAGFTLIEVLITVLVVAVGMLGLAKLQAAAVSESRVSRVRALMTFQAESLASLMRGNRAFWATTTSPFPSFAIAADGTKSGSYGSANGSDATCSTAGVVCSSGAMANADLTLWATAYTTQFPGATASITCVVAGGGSCTTGSTVPTSYDIKLGWTEKSVAINRSTVVTGGTPPTITMILHVQP